MVRHMRGLVSGFILSLLCVTIGRAEVISDFVILTDGHVHIGTDAMVLGGLVGSNLDSSLATNPGPNYESIDLLSGSMTLGLRGLASVHVGTNALVNGNITVNGNVTTVSGATINGVVNARGGLGVDPADGDVQGGTNATFNGDIHAHGDVNFNSGVTVNGSVFTKGDFTTGQNGLIQNLGNVDAEKKVDLGAGTTVAGNVRYGTTLTLRPTGSPTAQILGTAVQTAPSFVAEPQAFAAVPLMSVTAATPGVTSIVKTANMSTDLAVGDYKDIDLGNNNTLTLHSGTYNLHSLTMNSSSEIHLEFNAAMDPIHVLIGQDVVLGTASVNDLTIVVKVGSGPEQEVKMLDDGSVPNYDPGGLNMSMISLAQKVIFEVGRDFTLHANHTRNANNQDVGANWLGIVKAVDDIHLGEWTRTIGAMYANDDFEMLANSKLNGQGILGPDQGPVIVPEPSTISLIVGLAGLALTRRPRNSRGVA
ncbi:MAG: PEP-CTERM sorting domain-containing protein [Planctomycetes bacterium]|nr:PEP-CTERM sorting domain-containing protein [Planctomycetota bacterium]